MRLLQLATAPGRLIDLHPNVTVVAGLSDDERRLLADAVGGLAQGRAPSAAAGLLEAHGVLFELSEQMLALLDVAGEGLRPVVRSGDLPDLRQDPRARQRTMAERALAEVEERRATAREAHHRLEQTRDTAASALERARRDAHEADAGAAERIRLIDELTAVLDQAGERRRRLVEEQASRTPEAEAAVERLRDVEEATRDARTRHQEAAVRCSELAGRLDRARLGIDPTAVEEAEAAGQRLARIEAEVEAERAAEGAAGEAPPELEEPPVEWLARVQAGIEDLEKRLAAFGPTEALEVSGALARVRARQSGELVPSPEALVLADALAALEADLVATAGIGATSGGLAEARTRLDRARDALLEAEQAARNPELERGMVDRLETAHAEVLEALERADSRFGGARAQRRVDTARAAERALLDQLGFGSYSDYMMGYSLLHVDPEREAALDAARAELSAAEDAWRLLQAETEGELARAERMERRRLLVEEAAGHLGRPVPAGAAVAELRALRVPADLPAALVEDLQRGLDAAGVAVGGEDLELDELLLLAEAWLTEAQEAGGREQELRRELADLTEERGRAVEAAEAAARRTEVAGASPEDERSERLAAARSAVAEAEARRRSHLEADAAVDALTAELAAAAEDERLTATAAADAQAAVDEAQAAVERVQERLADIAEEIDGLARAEVEAKGHLESLIEHETASPEDLAREVAAAESLHAEADGQVAASARDVEEIEMEHRAAVDLLQSLAEGPDLGDQGSIAEEIEWYLLARLAAQRAVSLGGSLPLLLDDALGALDEQQLGHVLGRLERMADAVQVIVVTDDPLAVGWALTAGDERAAVVRPEAVPGAGAAGPATT